jgi:hypothetical protein
MSTRRTRRSWEGGQVRATPAGVGSSAPSLQSLRGGHDYDTRPADERTPRQIVADIHARMMVTHPHLADRIAAYEEKAEARQAAVEAAQEEGRERMLAAARATGRGIRSRSLKQQRVAEYAGLIAQGMSPAEAAARMGISAWTAQRYDADLKDGEAS